MTSAVAAQRSTSLDWGIRLIAALVCYLSLWTVLPAPTYSLLVLAVGAPEISPLLLAAALALLVVIVSRGRSRRLDRLALIMVSIAGILAALPVARIPATAERFDKEMTEALGRDFLCTVPPAARARLRASAIVPGELLTGLHHHGPVISMRDLPFPSPERDTLRFDAYRPDDDQAHPVVIDIYGGAWRRGAPQDDRAFAEQIAAAGYVVFAIDYHHAPQWKFPTQSHDVAAALDWIRHHAAEFHADSLSIAVIGRSSGAELALLAAYDTANTEIKGVVSYYGPVDLADGYRHPPSPDPLNTRPIEVDYLGGTPDQLPRRYRDGSPIHLIRSGLPPTLLIHGSRDHVVEVRFARALRDSLLASGDTAVLLEIPWAEHAFDKVTGGPGSQLAVYQVERFLAWLFARNVAPKTC